MKPLFFKVMLLVPVANGAGHLPADEILELLWLSLFLYGVLQGGVGCSPTIKLGMAMSKVNPDVVMSAGATSFFSNVWAWVYFREWANDTSPLRMPLRSWDKFQWPSGHYHYHPKHLYINHITSY